eukprot:jgi/Chrpa1/10625/Chrysochromulina_OHIO_Genome00015569-RA
MCVRKSATSGSAAANSSTSTRAAAGEHARFEMREVAACSSVRSASRKMVALSSASIVHPNTLKGASWSAYFSRMPGCKKLIILPGSELLTLGKCAQCGSSITR